jgi:type I restriction enzyme S subunit
MANNNNTKNLNVPNLRFPEFKGEWKEAPLTKYSKMD